MTKILRHAIIVLVLTFLLGTLLVVVAGAIAHIVLPSDIPYSAGGSCDVCGKSAYVTLVVDGRDTNEFCWLHAVVYEMDHPAVNLALKYPSVVVQLFSRWLLFIVAGIIVVPLYGDFRRLARDRRGIAPQYIEKRGLAGVAVGIVAWLTGGLLVVLGLYSITFQGTLFAGHEDGPNTPGLILLSIIYSLALVVAFTGAWEVMRLFQFSDLPQDRGHWYNWFDRVFSKDCSSAITDMRRGAALLTLGGIVTTALSMGLPSRYYLAPSVIMLSGGILTLVLGFWPIKKGVQTQDSGAL